ncbi:MAG: hypothetical protein WC955_02125 [Elusimicrobiota bacterium]
MMSTAISVNAEFVGIGAKIAALYGSPSYIVGPDGKTIYFNFGQISNPFFVIAVNTDTMKTIRYNPPMPEGSKDKWSLCRGFIWHPGVKKMFFGSTYEAYFFEFDPAKPELGIVNLGKPVETEQYVWEAEIGDDGKIYFCTFPKCKLISYDPYTKKFNDCGRAHSTNTYLRTLAKMRDGNILCGTGIEEADVVVYDVKRATFTSILPSELKGKSGFSSITADADGNTYASIGKTWYQVTDEYKMVEAKNVKPFNSQVYHPITLSDGRIVAGAGIEGDYTLKNPTTGVTEKFRFNYSGDGVTIMEITEGPDKKVYGSTALPLAMFRYDDGIKEKGVEYLGINNAAAQVYSFANYKDKMFTASYGNGVISLYDPAKPWNPGAKPENNPYNFVTLGNCYMRPRTMYLVDGKIYVFGITDYGNTTSGIAEIDPELCKVTRRYDAAVMNYGLSCAVYDPATKLHICGTTTHIGNRKPLEENASLLAFDIDKGTITWEVKLDTSNVYGIDGIALAEPGRIVLMYQANKIRKLAVVDTRTREVVHRNDAHSLSGGVWRLVNTADGRILGATSGNIFEVDTKDYSVKILHNTVDPKVKVSGPVSCGGYIYYGSGEKVYRFKD